MVDSHLDEGAASSHAHDDESSAKEQDTGNGLSAAVRFASAGEGTKELLDAFNEWSGVLTTRSIGVAFAVIAASWTVHGGAQQIVTNQWAIWSVGLSLLFLGFDLLVTWYMTKQHWDQVQFAEGNHERWETRFTETAGTNDPWPYTRGIETLGRISRLVKAFVPALAAALFLVSLFRT